MDVADHARLGFEGYITPMDRAINSPVHNDILGNNFSNDMALVSNVKGRTVQFTHNFAVDLNKSFGGNIPFDIQSFSDYRYVALTPRHYCTPCSFRTPISYSTPERTLCRTLKHQEA